jgi:soluble lytic murein transglycosylase-like protein
LREKGAITTHFTQPPPPAKPPVMKFLALLPFLLAPALAAAQTPAPPQIMMDIHNNDFSDAAALAEQTNDPLVEKLVTFYRLTAGAGSADEIQAFITDNPDWPQQKLLLLRLAQATGTSTPSSQTITPDFLTQISTLHDAGQDTAAAALYSSQGAAAFAAASPDQQQLFWPSQNTLARALLAANDPQNAYAVVTAVDPSLGSQLAPEQVTDRDFLAGFIALRYLKQPDQAALRFRALAAASPAVITQARAYYWLARCESGPAATADYQRAAAYPTTYYGQLASIALGESPTTLAARINAASEPAYSTTDALYFALTELPHAAVLLMQMNDPKDAAIFLNRAAQEAIDGRTRVMDAKLALGLGLPQAAVAIARSAGTAGQMLPLEGWPTPYNPPAATLDPATADGIMRQESSFDPTAISPSNALGLMQLLPATARMTARKAGLPDDNLFDPDQNMALGTTYLATELQNFGNCLPLAIAAYNAGPGAVARWLGENGDPELGHQPGGADIIDWVELIPYSETRNYVQRVSENITIYSAKLTGTANSPITPWLNK